MEAQTRHSLIYYILHWLVAALSVLVTAKVMPGWRIRGFWAALLAAVLIGFADVVIWPILIVLTLPVNIFTFGLFTFVVNGAVLKMCAGLMADFEIRGWWPAIFGALFLTAISSFFHWLFV